MAVERVEQREGATVFHINEPKPFGEPDPPPREVVLYHDPERRAALPRITRATINRMKEESREGGNNGPDWRFEYHKVKGVGTIVFVNDYFFDDVSSWRHRVSAHNTEGPYLLEEKPKKLPAHGS